MFVRAFIMLEWLSHNAAGMTVGELQRACKDFSKGQIDRTMRELCRDGIVLSERQKHGHTGKIVYRLARNFAVNCELLADKFFAQEVAK